MIFESRSHGWDFRFLHSPSPHWAVGPYWIQSRSHYDTGLQASWLVHRGHFDSAQSNLYLWIGSGGVRLRSERVRGAALAGLQADFETRDFYTAWMSEWGFRATDRPRFEHKARIGLAPYRGDDSKLNTWFIFESSYGQNPWWAESAKWKLTPMLRFYYQNVLWELGVSNHGELRWNWMVHL